MPWYWFKPKTSVPMLLCTARTNVGLWAGGLPLDRPPPGHLCYWLRLASALCVCGSAAGRCEHSRHEANSCSSSLKVSQLLKLTSWSAQPPVRVDKEQSWEMTAHAGLLQADPLPADLCTPAEWGGKPHITSCLHTKDTRCGLHVLSRRQTNPVWILPAQSFVHG